MNHYDDPLRDFYGWLILSVITIPVVWGFLLMFLSSIAGFIALFVSGGSPLENGGRISVQIGPDDIDEDY